MDAKEVLAVVLSLQPYIKYVKVAHSPFTKECKLPLTVGLTLFEISKEVDFVYFTVDLYPLLSYLAWIFLSNILNPNIFLHFSA